MSIPSLVSSERINGMMGKAYFNDYGDFKFDKVVFLGSMYGEIEGIYNGSAYCIVQNDGGLDYEDVEEMVEEMKEKYLVSRA
jgi:hypothetical protein